MWLFLIILPLCAAICWAVYKFSKFDTLYDFLAYSNIPTWRRRILAYLLYVLAISTCVVGLTEPYIYINVKDKEYSNVRIIFVIDVSRSMVFAEDVPPNRLESVRKEVKGFYESLDGVYECSILPFAGDVNPYFCPFTVNKTSFLNMLSELDWRTAPTLGTDITSAMEAIKDIYIKKDKIDKSGINIVVLLSDGGKEEALATNRIKLLQVTRELAGKNFKIYVVGVGSDKAAPLTIRDSKGGFIGYITDDNKKIMTSLLDEEILKQIAEYGNGQYYNLNSSTTLFYDLKQVINENRKLVSGKMKLGKLYLQEYLFSVTVCALVVCLLLNKV